MELVVLGGQGTWPDAGGACTGYLVREGGFTLWMDLGTGTMANLQRHVDLLDVDAVVVSHRHPDHLLDLFPYFYARLFHPARPTGLPLYLPPEAIDHVVALMSDQGGEELRNVFDVREVRPGSDFSTGPFRIRTAPMRHPVPTLGMRIESDGRVLAYSADTGPSEDLVELARDAGLLLSEATWLDVPGRAQPIHLSAGQAAEHASRADAGRLLLTHVRWTQTDRQGGLDRASAQYGGAIDVAEAGLEVQL
jgi:ribonuclease BN (tRNA processing enzyme)